MAAAAREPRAAAGSRRALPRPAAPRPKPGPGAPPGVARRRYRTAGQGQCQNPYKTVGICGGHRHRTVSLIRSMIKTNRHLRRRTRYRHRRFRQYHRRRHRQHLHHPHTNIHRHVTDCTLGS